MNAHKGFWKCSGCGRAKFTRPGQPHWCNKQYRKRFKKAGIVFTPTAESDGEVTMQAFSLFVLRREEDVTGVSGVGIVAYGVQFPDGTVALRWSGERPSTVVHESMENVRAIHCHNGKTEVVWIAATAGLFIAVKGH